MKILFNDGENDVITDTENLSYIGSGTEGTVYQYNNLAVKIHNDDICKYFINSFDIKHFLQLNTNRILLPKSPVYKICNDEKYYKGYTTKFVNNRKEFKEIINIDSNVLNNELDMINDDIITLTKNKINTCDNGESSNIVYNGGIYFVDPGSYTYSRLSTYKTLYKKNIEDINFSLYKNVFSLKLNIEYIKYELSKMFEVNMDDIEDITVICAKYIYDLDYHINFNQDENYIDYLKNILDKYNSLFNYKKQLIENSITNDEMYQPIKKLIKK